jgi:hypothetical protein
MTGIFRTILIYDIVLRVVKQSLVTNMLWDIQNLRKQQIMQDIQNVSYFFFFFYFYVFLKAIKRLKKNPLYMYIVSTIILTLLHIIRYMIFFHKLAMKLLLIFF